MGQLVYTKLDGCLDEDLMDKVIHTEVADNAHKVYTTWTMKDDLVVDGKVLAAKGEIMRQDPAVSILRGPGQRSIMGKLN